MLEQQVEPERGLLGAGFDVADLEQQVGSGAAQVRGDEGVGVALERGPVQGAAERRGQSGLQE